MYIAAKSMTGTVRVPSMSKTTPRRSGLEAVVAVDILDLVTELRGVLGRKRNGVERSEGMNEGRKETDTRETK